MSAHRRKFAIVSLSIVVAAFVSACGGSKETPPESKSTEAAVANPSSPEAQKYLAALKAYDEQVLPAAKKEGELNWYSSLRDDEAESMIKAFNKKYPDIAVNFVYGRGSQSIEKIAAETAAKRVVADVFWSGGQSSRVMGQRGFVDAYIPPSVIQPDVKFNWDVTEANGQFPIPFVRLVGVQINTNLVPKDKFPKTWWDFVRDPYWVDLHKKGLVGTDDPRRVSYAPYLIYGLKEVKKAEYGEDWVKQWAALKPKRLAADSGEIVRGEIYALVALGLTPAHIKAKAPITVHCPEPGCVTTQYMALIVKGAPHPNAAKAWNYFWFTKEGQVALAELGLTPARAGVPIHPDLDWQTHPQMFWPNNEAEQGIGEVVKWTVSTKVFDY